jgi:NADH:ubiquinone oxidoreductase subunit 5 (subunit L)/multisubunit Na+/H+ antiporter MnhA subunit
MLLIGGVLGWVFYLARKVDSWAFVSGSPVLKSIHTFLWNRWYMNSLYYAVFVDGLLAFKEVVFRVLEKGVIDKISGGVSMVTIALGRGLSIFEKRFLEEAKGREDELYKTFFGLHESMTMPSHINREAMSIYKEALSDVP